MADLEGSTTSSISGMVEGVAGAVGAAAGALISAYDEVTITLDEIREIASTQLNGAVGDAQGMRSRLLGIPGGTSGTLCWAPIFGETPEGVDVERAHGQALDRFLEVVGVIEQRLVDMQTALIEALRAYENTDAGVSEVLARYNANVVAADSASATTVAPDATVPQPPVAQDNGGGFEGG